MINFTKMQGLGNDYVFIYCIDCNVNTNTMSSLARFVSNRHFGVGSDGVILIGDSDIADFKMRIFNSDGSEAEMCGNGIRCVGKFVHDKGLTGKKDISIETLAGIKYIRLNIENEQVKSVTVDMGEPILECENIPVDSKFREINVQVEDRVFCISCVSMGNPHGVIVVDDLESFNIQKYGPILESDKHFPNKANIEFVSVLDRKNIKMRVWERGSSETLACGTGACATMVACNLKGLVEDKVNIHLLGGDLEIEWNKENNHVYMTGPAETVFEGELDYDNN